MNKNLKNILLLFLIINHKTILTIPTNIDLGVPTNAALRKSSHPFISGDTFRAFCDHIFDETNVDFNPQSVKHGDTVFVNTYLLEQFFKQAHPYILNKYIIVSHNSDDPIPGKFAPYLDDQKIIAWFGQNIDIKDHPKLHPLPIGLANYHWPHGKIEIVKNAKNTIPSPENRHGYKAYLNFLTSTNRAVRSKLWNYFKEKPFCSVAQNRIYSAYLEDMKLCKFVISPRGNGLDCHRYWEALLMRCIPIMKHSTIEALFDDLPIIFVDDWSQVTQDFLQRKYLEMKNKTYNYKKLYVDYWLNQIRDIQTKSRALKDYVL